MAPRFNHHHVIYERRACARDRWMNQLRNHPGLLLPIDYADHNDLHAHLRSGVPRPDTTAIQVFLHDIVLPYDREQPRTQTLDQAIGFFTMTGNFATAEHLAEQRDFITRHPLWEE